MSALSIRNMNWAVGQHEQLLDVRCAVSPLVKLQISLDIAHSMIANGLQFCQPGMVKRGLNRVEEIKARVYEIL